MSDRAWLVAGGAGVLVTTAAIVVMLSRPNLETVEDAREPSSSSTQAPGANATETVPVLNVEPDWIGRLEQDLSGAERDIVRGAASEDLRTLYVLTFTYREAPVYEPRVITPFLDAVTEYPETDEAFQRNSIAIGMLARTWLLAGPNAEAAPDFTQAALQAATTDDPATQTAALVLLEELVGSGQTEISSAVQTTIENLQRDGFNSVQAERFRASVLGLEN